MNGSDNVLLICELFEEEDFLFSPGDFEDLFAFGLGYELKGALGLLVGNENLTVFRMSFLHGNRVLLDFLVQVGSLLETRLELLIRLQGSGHEFVQGIKNMREE